MNARKFAEMLDRINDRSMITHLYFKDIVARFEDALSRIEEVRKRTFNTLVALMLGFVLLPAIFFSVADGRYWSLGLLVAMVLTMFSVGKVRRLVAYNLDEMIAEYGIQGNQITDIELLAQTCGLVDSSNVLTIDPAILVCLVINSQRANAECIVTINSHIKQSQPADYIKTVLGVEESSRRGEICAVVDLLARCKFIPDTTEARRGIKQRIFYSAGKLS